MAAVNSASPAHATTGRRLSAGGRIATLLAVGAAIALVLASGLLGCSSPKSGTDVSIHDLQFDPKVLTVPKGATVTWTNNDQTAHTITSDSADSTTVPKALQFKSDALNPGQTFSRTFDEAGSYPYHCDIHPYLKGEVIVK